MGTSTWKDSFALPYETSWSIRQKKRYIDGYSVINDRSHEKALTDNLRMPDSTSLSMGMRYCPKCAKHGYVSIMHQYSFLDECFIHHGQALEAAIPKNSITKTSFYEDFGTRAIDIMDNEEFRKEINSSYPIDFDALIAFDLLYRNRYFILSENDKVRNAMAQRFLTGQFPSYVKKLTTIHSSENVDYDARYDDGTYKNHILAEIDSMQKITDRQLDYFKIAPEFMLLFLLYNEYVNQCKTVGGADKLQSVFNDILTSSSSVVTKNNCYLYGRCINLAMMSRYLTVKKYRRLIDGQYRAFDLQYVYSGLNMIFNNGIFVYGKKKISSEELTLVKERILKDLLNNFSITIGNELIAEKFRIRDWIENSREFPVNAYIAIWKGEETELWLCDTAEPKTDKRVA